MINAVRSQLFCIAASFVCGVFRLFGVFRHAPYGRAVGHDRTDYVGVPEFARTYVANQIRVIREEFAAQDSLYRDSVLVELREIENKIPDMKYAFEN